LSNPDYAKGDKQGLPLHVRLEKGPMAPYKYQNGGLPKYQTKGRVTPTKLDSLFLLENNQIIDNYLKKGAKWTHKDEVEDDWENRHHALVSDLKDFIPREIENYRESTEKSQDERRYYESRYGTKKGEVKDYIDKIGKFTGARDWVTGGGEDINFPFQYLHPQIKPTFSGDLEFDNRDIYSYGYDDLAITPWSMIPDDKKEERVRKYGPSGVPDSYINPKPIAITSSTFKFEQRDSKNTDRFDYYTEETKDGKVKYFKKEKNKHQTFGGNTASTPLAEFGDGGEVEDIPKYQNDGRVQGNVNDWFINKQELEDYSEQYNRMASKCKTGGCLERTAMYYDQNIAGLLGTPRYNTIRDNAGIGSSDPKSEDYTGPHSRYEEYEHSADSWDIHGLLQEKGAKQIYAHPLESNSKIAQSWLKFRKKPIEEQEQYWRDLNIPLGSIVGMGYAGGVGTRGTKSYNKEKGLVPSNHSGMVAGYDETGLPYIYDWDKIVPITETRYDYYPITNITAPKEVEKFTYDYLKNSGKLSDTYRPLKIKVSDKETNSEYDSDEFDPFIKALEDNKLEISNALGIDFNMYDELAKRAVATAISETKGGDDTTVRWMSGFPVPSYLTDKLGLGKTTGITQINEDLIWARVGTEEQRKGNRMPAKLNALGIKEKDYDPWDPEQQAKSTIAFLYDNLEVARQNLKSGVNEETGTKNKLDLPDELVQYYQWFQPGLMGKGEAWGESEKVKNFAKAYGKVSTSYPEETPTVLSPPASDSNQYVEQDPLYTSLLNTFQNGGEIKEDYNIKRAEELGYTRDETGHMPSVDHETGMWLKSKEHPTAYKEYISMMLNPDIKAVVNPEGYFEENQLQYIPRKENGGEVLPEELPHQEIVSFPTEREPAGDPRVPKFASAQDYYTNLENTPVPKTLSKKYKIWESSYKSPMGLPIESYKNIYDVQAFFNSGDWKENFESIEKYRKSSHPMLGTTDPKTNTFIPSEENLNTNEEIASHIDINDIPVNFKKVERIPINPDGFAPGSATEFADKVVIPSGNITMKDMQEPILANGEMLMPGDEAQFDTDYVVEEKLPKAQDGLTVEGNWNDPVLDPSSNYRQIKRQKEVEDFARQVIKKEPSIFDITTQEGRDNNPLSYFPLIGDALDAMSFGEAVDKKDYETAALYGLFGAIPGAAGPIVNKVKPYVNKLKSFFKASPTPAIIDMNSATVGRDIAGDYLHNIHNYNAESLSQLLDESRAFVKAAPTDEFASEINRKIKNLEKGVEKDMKLQKIAKKAGRTNGDDTGKWLADSYIDSPANEQLGHVTTSNSLWDIVFKSNGNMKPYTSAETLYFNRGGSGQLARTRLMSPENQGGAINLIFDDKSLKKANILPDNSGGELTISQEVSLKHLYPEAKKKVKDLLLNEAEYRGIKLTQKELGYINDVLGISK